MHPIKRYCEKHGLNQKEFADAMGLSAGFVSQLITGREKCGRRAGLKIVQRCGGEITLQELLTWEPRASVESPAA